VVQVSFGVISRWITYHVVRQLRSPPHPSQDPEQAPDRGLERDLPELIVERAVIEYPTRSRFCREIQILNGLRSAEFTRALEGENVGTILQGD
jgi:hypothetical protein